GSDKPVRKNYEIYSGLGLLLSPSSSTGNDLEDIGGSTIESPGCVLRDMTSVFVPGDRLLSPLNESLLCLTKVGAIKDKSCMKGIVKVRNSYKDLYDTEVEDQNKPTKVVESPTRNGVVNGKNVEGNKSCAVVSDTQQTEVAPAEAASHDNWVAYAASAGATSVS
ncbi:hypothetical protein Tco_0056936, partial [Tanacetum coccineum]